MSVRAWKAIRDIGHAPGRFLLVVLGLAIGVAAVTTLLVAFSVLTREVAANYAWTRPASAHLRLAQVDAGLLQEVRRRPGVAAASADATIGARIRVGRDEWLPLLLFAAPDLGDRQVARLGGALREPPPTGAVWIERSALPLTRAAVGDEVFVEGPSQRARKVRITGVIHDPALAPAWQENAVYAYATPQTAALLGATSGPEWLRVRFRDVASDARAAESRARALAQWLDQNGHAVSEVRVPPPGKHPHQSQMTAALSMLLAFGVLGLLLAAMVAATVVGNLLLQHTRQIAIMKAVGASSTQILAQYLGLVAALALAATVVAVPVGVAAGQAFANLGATQLNIEIAQRGAEGWVLLVALLAGLLLPILVALPPILSAARRTVRKAIDDHGIVPEAGAVAGRRWHASLAGGMWLLALRNVLRRRLRPVLVASSLAMAGAVFIASLNLKDAWSDTLAQADAERRYDLGISMHRPIDEPRLLETLQRVPGVGSAESWPVRPVAKYSGDTWMLTRAYPDGSHGALSLRAVAADTALVSLPVVEGRWLAPSDSAAVVLNAAALKSFAGVAPGSRIRVLVDGRDFDLTVVGIVRETLAGGALYTTPESFSRMVGNPGVTDIARVALDDPGQAEAMARGIRADLASRGMQVRFIVTRAQMMAGQAAHLRILIIALLAIAITMAVVGGLGLAAALVNGVTDRTRELGVLRALGARSRYLMQMVILECLVVVAISWLFAILLSLPTSWAIGRMSSAVTGQPLALAISVPAAIAWLVLVLMTGMIACTLPARHAARLTIAKALAVR